MSTFLPVDEIIISPDRQRKDLGDIEEMRDSLRRIGQINPIVVDEQHVLVAGERRLRAAIAEGWTHIMVTYREDLDPLTRHLIELEENIKRKDLTWQEQVDAVVRYHEIRKSSEPDWSITATADAIGVSQANVTKYLAVGREIAGGNEKVATASKLSVATGLAQRAQQRKAQDQVNSVATTHPTAKHLNIEKPRPYKILNEDFNTWARSYKGPKFNLVHCDFPYGINAQDIQQGVAVERHGGYDDSVDVYMELIDTLGVTLDSIVTENAHMIFWLSWKHFEKTKALLRAQGWKVLDYPLIWFKSDNAGLLPDPKRGPRYVNEVALFCTRGDRFIVQAVANTVAHPTESDVHMSIKPEVMLKHFLRMLVDDTSVLLDPTCGSGSAIRAAARLGAKLAIGLEKDPEFAKLAQAKLEDFYHEEP